jgi:hypothetical protein
LNDKKAGKNKTWAENTTDEDGYSYRKKKTGNKQLSIHLYPIIWGSNIPNGIKYK